MEPTDLPDDARGAVWLWWLPVGAGGHVVRHTSRWWELAVARREHRAPAQLVHAALEVELANRRHLIEMAPQWGGPRAERGVVLTGPVGLRPLGRSRFFRYEVRCWPDGVLADRAWAVAGPVPAACGGRVARAVLAHVARAPALTWGRRVGAGQEMWNSNSLVAWLLDVSGIDVGPLGPPAGTRAPGWSAGLAEAAGEPRG